MREVIALLVLISMLPAVAGDKITQSNDMNNQTAGNISGDDSFGLGLANQLGAPGPTGDCYSSKQWNAVVFSRQDSTFNKWCAAAWYDANGKHNLAAQMRCQIPEIAKLDYPEGCVAANTIVAPTAENIDLTQLVNFLVIRQDAITEPLSEEVQTLRMELEKQESERRAAERRSQIAYQRQKADEQQYAGNLLQELREFSEESTAKNR